MGQTTSGGLAHLTPHMAIIQPRTTDLSLDVIKDYTDEIPDDCVASILQFLRPADRKRCSLVCRRWRTVEGQRRHRLTLNGSNEVSSHLPAIFTRFHSVTRLILRCDRKTISINDDDLNFISKSCPNLTSFKLRNCYQITDQGMLVLAQNCKSLRKISCGSFTFGAKGLNAILNNCASLESFSVRSLLGNKDGSNDELVMPGNAALSLKSILLGDLYTGQFFAPLLIGSKNLTSIILSKCSGDWDGLLKAITGRESCLKDIRLDKIQVSDSGLIAISKCPNLETFRLSKSPDCSDKGISAIAENCKLLRKLYIDGWKTNRIGDEGLTSVAKNCTNLVELVLTGINLSSIGMMAISTHCLKLERLAICGSETIKDPEISCISAKCKALKKLYIKFCRVTNIGLQTFASGCPNLVKMRVYKCEGVSSEGMQWLSAKRASLSVKVDGDKVEGRAVEPSTEPLVTGTADVNVPLTINGEKSCENLGFSVIAGESELACGLVSLVDKNMSPNHQENPS